MAHGYPDFEGDKSAIYLSPEWATVEGVDKVFQVNASDVGEGVGKYVTYVVPANKILYVKRISVAVWGYLPADRDNNQICTLQIIVGPTTYASIGGNGGANLDLIIPLPFVAGQNVLFQVVNQANHHISLFLTASAYELSV